MSETPHRVIVTSAPPNPNGDLHLGHLSGPFLGADVLRRYLRQTGDDVVYVGYSDDYSCYVPRRGAEIGLTAHETAHVFGRRMEETLGLANMAHDYFTHPLREPVHREIVQRFFVELWNKGVMEVVDLPVYWCVTCERYLYEAEMRGRCQYCAAPSDGFYCEECGRPQDTTGLVEAKCTACWQEPEIRQQRRITFPLENYRDQLREYYSGRAMRPRLRAYLDDMFARPLPRTTVARTAAYGIPVPVEGWDGYILDTWYSGIWGYLAATVALGTALGDADAPLRAWADPDTRVYEFIGFDCSFSHALLWPALFLAHGDLKLPDQVVTNEFYRLEGDKFSTSRGHAIWGNDFLRRVPADQLRFYLCLTGPEREQTNFSAADFRDTVQRLLVDGLQHWLNTVVAVVREDFGGTVPGERPADGPLAKLSGTLCAEVGAPLDPDGFSPQAATAVLRDTIERAQAALPSLAALRSGDRAGYAAEVSAHVELLARFAAAAAPVMPAFAEYVWTAFGLPYQDPVRRVLPWPAEVVRLVPAGTTVPAAVPTLFRPVDG
jgi:methionyl-tRNA synthetase